MRSTASYYEDTLSDMSLGQLTLLGQLLRQAESLHRELISLKEMAADFQKPGELGDDCLLGAGTVLVADDHPVVRAIARELLESFGYRVVKTASESAHTIDVVLLDLPLADAQHVRSIESARRSAPAARLVACTPLPEGPARARLRALGVHGFISKPYRPRDVARCIGRVMRGN